MAETVMISEGGVTQPEPVGPTWIRP